MKRLPALCIAAALLAPALAARADNPLFLDQFSADPTARNFNGKIYLVNSHDILPPNGGRGGFFMADYHIHSSDNLMDWTDHGVIVDQKDVPWANQNYGMWAPDLVFKNGKYYFYFPTNSKDTADPASGGRGRAQGIQRVGVATADKPEGPYKIEPTYIPNIPPSIDPTILQDPKDGSAYLIYAMNDFFIAKLKDNMLEMAEEPQLMHDFPNSRTQGLIEGPFAFERNGKYYVAYPHAKGTELLEYAMADSPKGPYTYKGIIMDQSASKCWTNQCSLVEYQGQWLIFYHDDDLSPRDNARRCVHADYITFNADGTINKVTPTLRGVGICDARRQIQIDRYSAISKTGAADSFLDDNKKSDGWKVTLSEKDAFVQYDRVDFGKAGLKRVKLRVNSAAGGTLEIRLDGPGGPQLATVVVPAGEAWQEVSATLTKAPADVHNLLISQPAAGTVAVDWVSFE